MSKTNLDSLNPIGGGGGAVDPNLQNQVNQIDNRLTSLSNIAAKTNLSNTFTTHQIIQGYVKNSAGLYKEGIQQTLSTVKSQSGKSMDLMFIQNSTGFRNWCTMNIKFRYGDQTDSQAITLLKIESHNTDTGMFMQCEGNKLSFITEHQIANVKNPVNPADAANKRYVDETIGQFIDLENWTGNFKTTSLVWTKNSQFSRPGKFEFIINIKNGNNNYQFNTLLELFDVTHTYYLGGIDYYPADVAGVKPKADSGCYFVYENKALKIGKWGNNQPGDNTQIKIRYRGVK